MAEAAATMSSLAHYWHPIAEARDVTDQPKRFYLLERELVAFRGSDGRVAVFRDLCIHRGTALSLGWVSNGHITCAYHGWEYDATGRCVRIPALPEGRSVPPRARAIAYRAEERYGLVWVALEEPVAAIPPYPFDEDRDPGYHMHLSSHNIWHTSVGRAVENFMDYSHFPLVHPNLLAPPDQTVVPDLEVESTPNGLKYLMQTVEPETPSSPRDDLVTYEYYYVTPFTVHIRKIRSAGGVTYVSLFGSPTRARQADLFVMYLRNDMLDVPDSEYDEFCNRVLEQDRRIVESQQPEEIPIDLREELHLKVPDAPGIALRRVLAGIGGTEPYMP